MNLHRLLVVLTVLVWMSTAKRQMRHSSRVEGPCWKSASVARNRIERGIRDVSIPSCTRGGYFKPRQCSVLFCRCVDRYGKTVRGSITRGRDRFGLDCAKNITSTIVKRLTKCRQARQRALALIKRGIADLSPPVCTSSGEYRPLQCQVFFCKCVDKDGNTVPGSVTRSRRGGRRINCGDFLNPLTSCQRAQAKARALSRRGMMDVSGPRCTSDGDYAPLQCNVFGRCHCVKADGRVIPGSKHRRGSEGSAYCDLFLEEHEDPETIKRMTHTPCWKEQERTNRLAAQGLADVGGPSCTPSGEYRALQCGAFFCKCVYKNGRTIPGTVTGTGSGPPKNCSLYKR